MQYDEEGLCLGEEVRPGVMAGPWEVEHCKHGRIYRFRWIWPKGSSIESSHPEMGRNVEVVS